MSKNSLSEGKEGPNEVRPSSTECRSVDISTLLPRSLRRTSKCIAVNMGFLEQLHSDGCGFCGVGGK